MARILIGTSGWTYSSWRGTFYSEYLPSRRYLEFYAQEFPTAEVNYSFYHLLKPATYEKWAGQVPEEFVFSVKASRLISHTKRLKDVEEPWETFVGNARSLGAHLGPVLLQFPPSFRCDRCSGGTARPCASRIRPAIHAETYSRLISPTCGSTGAKSCSHPAILEPNLPGKRGRSSGTCPLFPSPYIPDC